jgi:imidazolonepropionase-like amidohydrolase
VRESLLALVGATVIDGTGAPATAPASLLIEGDRIAAVAPRADLEIPEAATVIDVPGLTVLPGLIDLHAHLCWAPNLEDPMIVAQDDPFVPDSYMAMWGVHHAAAYLQAGFTTVRDAFAWSGRRTSLALRDAIRDGAVRGPRIVPAGYAGMTGTEVDIRMPPTVPRPYGFVADGPWELRKRVRECVREGYEWIKTFTTGGRVSGGQEVDTWYVNHTPEEMDAIVDEAHRFGVGVMVHTSTREGIKLALDAGVDTVEHGWPLDDELIGLMLAKDIALVPTISVYSERGFLRDGVQPELRARAENQIASRAASFERAYAAGVRIGHGTDVHPPMPTMRPSEAAFELATYVRLGMDPMDAIVSATGGAARILGMQEDVGTLVPGRIADVIVVDGDPLADPSVLEHGVRLVIAGGQIHHDLRAEVPAGA